MVGNGENDKTLTSRKLYIASIWVLCKSQASLLKTNSKISENGNYSYFTACNVQVYYTKDDEMGETCNMYVEDVKCLQYCAQELLKEEANLCSTM